MSNVIGSSLNAWAAIEQKKYLEQQGTKGGTADGFRQHFLSVYQGNPDEFAKFITPLICNTADREWQKQPRRDGPDLFSINGYTIPEFITRRAKGAYISGDDIEKDSGGPEFEKVDAKYATVQDFLDGATVKLRKAAQSSAAAEKEMRAADEAMRRAGNRHTMMLSAVID